MGFTFPKARASSGVGYLFPGQGSQSVGMGSQLYDLSPSARSVFHEVDMALGRPLTKLVFNGPEDQLRDTMNAQPAIMAVSLATAMAMEERLGPTGMPPPAFMAGHSLGEFTALAVAGVLEVGEAARLVQERGRLMQAACEQQPGGMAAVFGLDLDTIEEISRETGTYVSNINTAEQVVISGDLLAIAHALDLASARGAKRTVPLRVGGAFHSALMEPAKEGLVRAVSDVRFKDPRIPIVGNCTGEPLSTANEVKSEVISQISSCVQWKRSMDFMLGAGVARFIEIGPGRTLSGMAKRMDRSVSSVSVSDMDSVLSFGAK